MGDSMVLSQIAMSVLDLPVTHRWYQDTFGYQPSGGTVFACENVARVQDLPDVTTAVWWLVDQQEFFQLEMFQYSSPVPVRSDGRGLGDVGYAMFGVHVSEFDAVLEKVRSAGQRPLTAPAGLPGARRFCLRDPNGVLVEVMEDCAPSGPVPRPEVPVATRFVTLSVLDLDAARSQWLEAFTMVEDEPDALHRPSHEELWRMDGARRRSAVLWAGDRAIELVQYLDPQPNPRPTGYRICDQGLLNIAMGARSKETLSRAWERLREHTGEGRFLDMGDSGMVGYADDHQGFSIELQVVDPAWDHAKGYAPQPADAPPLPTVDDRADQEPLSSAR